MNGIINKVSDFMVSTGDKAANMAGAVNYQTWLVLSALVVIAGFYFLKGHN